jgi:hypothetical protein
MSTQGTIGIIVLGVTGAALIAECAWRNVAGRLTGGMVFARVSMIVPTIIGAYLVLEALDWAWYLRLPVALVGGFVAWDVYYRIVIVLVGIVLPPSDRRATSLPPA